MVNTRAKIKKTQNISKACFSHASMEDSDHPTTQSGAIIGSNDDLLTEILLRLPVTSILRFKSVSKHWLWLLSQKHFIRMHDNLPKKSPGLFVHNTYVPFDVENRSTPPLIHCLDRCGIKIMQSCNGLLLCCSTHENTAAIRYYVFNPTTKQWAFIPPVPGGVKVRKTIRFMGLAYHQTACVHYKVVCLRRVERVSIRRVVPDDDLFQIYIYSSDTANWKICTETLYTDSSWFSKGVYWNGAIHWATYYHNHFYFKIEAEQLQTLPLPLKMTSFKSGIMYFGESRGHLHRIVAVDHDETGLHLNVHEMLSDYSGWFVKYRVDLYELVAAFPEMIGDKYNDYDFKVIDVVRGEKEEDTFVVLLILPGKLIRYNVHDKSFKQIFNFSDGFSSFLRVEAHRYIETLSSF